MQISIVGRHIKVSSALRSYIEEKLQRIKRHFKHIIQVHVTLDVEKNRHFSETTILIGKAVFNSKAETENMYSTIDTVIDKLERQIRNYKEKRKKHKVKELSRIKPKKVVLEKEG